MDFHTALAVLVKKSFTPSVSHVKFYNNRISIHARLYNGIDRPMSCGVWGGGVV